MRVLVTGSAGFLGRALVERLRRRAGLRLFLTDILPAPRSRTCDLLDRDAARGLVRDCRPRLVFHMAGMTRPGPWQDLWDAHVTTTVNLLDALLRLPRAQRPRVVVAGSSAEYGAARRLPVTESAPPRPVSVYGATKLSQTLAALSFRHHGLVVAVARMFNVMGPGMPEHLALGSFARQIASAEAAGGPARVMVGDLGTRRDYIDVRDAAAALEALSSPQVPGGVFNVCSGRSRTMRELLSRLTAMSACPVGVSVDRARLRPSDVREFYGDSRRLRRATGWKPLIPPAQSLRDTLDWHRCRLAART
ncbi:MAG: GDP-mannose 4,6-dehydratase [Elusimicrobia bacterium]|nr:GDP-mannose 4,6-dehydratase [Elusimicrobiota bacterium]